MTGYLQPHEELPLDGKHRWLAFSGKPGQSLARITSTLRNLGVYAWNVQQSSTKVGSTEVAYTTIIEATVGGITPVKLAMRLGTNKLTVTLDPVPWSLELWIDAQEFVDPSPVPVDFLTGNERLNPGAYYGVLANWFGVSPTMNKVALALKSAGYDVITETGMVGATEGSNKFFYLGTQEKNPSLSDLQTVIRADGLYVNKYPFDNAAELRRLTGAKLALEKGLKDFATSFADASAAVTELAGGAVETVGTLAQVGRVLLYAVPVVLVGGLGYWGYTKVREA